MQGKSEKAINSSQLNKILHIFKVALAESWISEPFLEKVVA